MNAARRLLAGQSRGRTLRSLVVVAAHAVAFGAIAAVSLDGYAGVTGLVLSAVEDAFFSHALLLVTVLAVALAYLNDGLAVCWLAVYLPLLAVAVQVPPPGFLEPITPLEWFLRRLWAPAREAVVYGTLGFAVGAGGRRAVGWLRATDDPAMALVAWWWRGDTD